MRISNDNKDKGKRRRKESGTQKIFNLFDILLCLNRALKRWNNENRSPEVMSALTSKALSGVLSCFMMMT